MFRVKLSNWSTSSKPLVADCVDTAPSMDFVPHPSRYGVTIVPFLRNSVDTSIPRCISLYAMVFRVYLVRS